MTREAIVMGRSRRCCVRRRTLQFSPPRSLMLLILFCLLAFSLCEANDGTLVIHRRRECTMDTLARTAFADVAANDSFFDASSDASSVSWTRIDTCGAVASADCVSGPNVAVANGHLVLSASPSIGGARVSATIPHVSFNVTTRLRIHASFHVNTTDATIALTLPLRHGVAVVSLSLLTSPSVLRLSSPTYNWTVDVPPPCPLTSNTKLHIVDLEWTPDRWLRWHWNGHLLRETRFPKRDVTTKHQATVRVDLSVVPKASGSFRIKTLEVQRVSPGQDEGVCRPRVLSPDANCRHHTHFEPRLGADQGYLSLAQIYEFVRTAPSRFPSSFATVEEIGVSMQNRSLLALCIGACTRADVPQTLFTGMHHSREPISMMNLVYTIDLLALDVANGVRDTLALLLSRQLWFVLVVNPDGYARNEELETWAHQQSGQRKNARGGCERNPSDSGVDLNRNYDVCFNQDNVGSSTDPCGEDFRGPAPFSEPETLAIKRFVEKPTSHFSTSLNYHSFGRYFNVPFACQALDTPQGTNSTIFENWAKEMTRYNRFQYGQPWKDSNLYSVNGETSDWLWLKHGIFAMSPEVGPAFSTRVDLGFWPTRDEVPALAVELHYSNLVAARLAGPRYDVVVTNVTRQLVTEQSDEALLQVEIEVQNHGLRVAGDVDIVFTTALADTNASTTFTTTITIPAMDVGTIENKPPTVATRVLAIPEVAVIHIVVRDSLSCQYIRLTTQRQSRRARQATIQQWDAVELPLCGFCRSIGRDTKQLAVLGDAPTLCPSMDDLVNAEGLSRAQATRLKTLDVSLSVDSATENREGTTVPVVAKPSPQPVQPSATPTAPTRSESSRPPHSGTTSPSDPDTTSAQKPTTAVPSATQPLEDTVSAAAKSSTVSSNFASFATVPVVVGLLAVVLIVLLFVVRRRRQLKTATSNKGTKPGKRKTYVKVVNDEAEAEQLEDEKDDDLVTPVSRKPRHDDSDDEDAEYGRRRNPNASRPRGPSDEDVMV